MHAGGERVDAGAPAATGCGGSARHRLRRGALIALSDFPPWSVDALIGFAYSTSFLPRTVLGDHAEEFEADVRRELAQLEANGELSETIDFAYALARRPGYA